MVVLLVGIGGLLLADYKFKLVFYKNRLAATKTIAILIVLLLSADIVGVGLGIFYTNQSYVTGLYIFSKNVPIEELFFLFLLSYVALAIYELLTKLRFFGKLQDDTKAGK